MAADAILIVHLESSQGEMIPTLNLMQRVVCHVCCLAFCYPGPAYPGPAITRAGHMHAERPCQDTTMCHVMSCQGRATKEAASR